MKHVQVFGAAELHLRTLDLLQRLGVIEVHRLHQPRARVQPMGPSNAPMSRHFRLHMDQEKKRLHSAQKDLHREPSYPLRVPALRVHGKIQPHQQALP